MVYGYCAGGSANGLWAEGQPLPTHTLWQRTGS